MMPEPETRHISEADETFKTKLYIAKLPDNRFLIRLTCFNYLLRYHGKKTTCRHSLYFLLPQPFSQWQRGTNIAAIILNGDNFGNKVLLYRAENNFSIQGEISYIDENLCKYEMDIHQIDRRFEKMSHVHTIGDLKEKVDALNDEEIEAALEKVRHQKMSEDTVYDIFNQFGK